MKCKAPGRLELWLLSGVFYVNEEKILVLQWPCCSPLLSGIVMEDVFTLTFTVRTPQHKSPEEFTGALPSEKRGKSCMTPLCLSHAYCLPFINHYVGQDSWAGTISDSFSEVLAHRKEKSTYEISIIIPRLVMRLNGLLIKSPSFQMFLLRKNAPYIF